MVRNNKMIISILIVLIVVIFTAFGQLSMKAGMNEIGAISVQKMFNPINAFHVFTNKFEFIGVVLYASSLLIWLSVLSRVNVSVAYPLLSLGYIITALLAFAFLREELTSIRVLGVVIVIFGCFLITRV